MTLQTEAALHAYQGKMGYCDGDVEWGPAQAGL